MPLLTFTPTILPHVLSAPSPRCLSCASTRLFTASPLRRVRPRCHLQARSIDAGDLDNDNNITSSNDDTISPDNPIRDHHAPEDNTNRIQAESSQHDTESTPKRKRPKRPMSAESRAKISAALKGRRKSAAHRESLRRRFEGDGNPMYGRKLSAESRAKISRAMAARKRRDDTSDEKKDKESVSKDEKVIDVLREKAVNSRLLTSSADPQKRRSAEQRKRDEMEARDLESMLEKVRSLQTPPESVVRQRRLARRQRGVRRTQGDGDGKKNDEEEGARRQVGNEEREQEEVETQEGHEQREEDIEDFEEEVASTQKRQRHGKTRESKKLIPVDHEECKQCRGSGMEECSQCVLAFGVVSARCTMCFGSGSVFCKQCEGVGAVRT